MDKRISGENIEHRFTIAGQAFYLKVCLDEANRPYEMALVATNTSLAVQGLQDSLFTTVSLALQQGVPLTEIVQKFKNTRFEPYGPTSNPSIPMASSPMDYIARWLEQKFPAEGPTE